MDTPLIATRPLATEDLDMWATRVRLDAEALVALKQAGWKVSTLLDLAAQHGDRNAFRADLMLSPAAAGQVTARFYPSASGPPPPPPGVNAIGTPPHKRRQSAGFKQTPMKKASSEGILQYQIIAPKNHEELQKQLNIVILDEAAINDTTQNLPKSLQALLQKLAQSSTMSLSELAATFNCTEAQVNSMKQNLVDRLDKIQQSEKDTGKTRKERVYHTAFDPFVELIMDKHFAVDFDSSLPYKGSPEQKRSKVLIPDAGIGLRLGDEFAIVRTRLQELLGHRLVDILMLPWFLFEYKQAATSEEGLEKLACELLLIEQNMEVLLHGLGVRAEDDLGDLRLPFAVAAHLGPGSCRFMALSPNENERGLRPCIRLARIPWTDSNRILTGFAHIVDCGKRFWSTIKAAVDLNRQPLSVPLSSQTSRLLDALPPIVPTEPYLWREVLEKGRIYRCQKRGGQQVILKAFSASDPNLEHEYRMLRLLHSHPNLFVQLHTAVTFGSARLALEMEYIHDAVVPFCPQSDAELQCYMCSLLNALHVLHDELHLIHGDIKPDNLMFRPHDGSIKLIDFESAAPGPAAPARKPTQGYTAPEMRSSSPRPTMYYASDIYAAGCAFMLLLGGVTMWEDDHGEELSRCTTAAELTEWLNVHYPRRHASLLSVSNDGLVLARQMLRRAPSQRLTAQQCLQSTYFRHASDHTVAFDKENLVADVKGKRLNSTANGVALAHVLT